MRNVTFWDIRVGKSTKNVGCLCAEKYIKLHENTIFNCLFSLYSDDCLGKFVSNRTGFPKKISKNRPKLVVFIQATRLFLDDFWGILKFRDILGAFEVGHGSVSVRSLRDLAVPGVSARERERERERADLILALD